MNVYSQIASNKRRTVILMLLFGILVIALGFVFSQAMDGGIASVILACIIAVGMSFISYYSGDKLALWTAGAKGPVTKEENAYVYRLVENLCITAGLPMPKVYLIPDPAINAFATGRDPQHASIAITMGAIEQLENEELEGVIAHELSHIKNYDIRLMMVVIICVSITTLLANWFFRFSFFGDRRSNRNNGSMGLIFILLGIVMAILSPLAAKIIQLSISRKREFLADASAALLTRYPEGLARALEKIAANPQPMIKANKAIAHLYFSSSFGAKKGWFSHMFSTHPPIEERVNALRQIA
jgi:heat shock protein HtpX